MSNLSLNVTSNMVRTTLPFLQNSIVTIKGNTLEPPKNPRWSKGVYSWFVLKIRAQKGLEHLEHLKRYFKLAGENIDNNNKKVPKELKKCLQGVQGSPDLERCYFP